MATKKKGSGVNKIAKMILGGKTAAPKKNLRSKMSDKISFIKAFEGQTDFSFRASNIAAQINLDTRWSQLGRDMSANLNNYNDEYTDVTNDETFEQTQENFETIQKQIEVISQFMIRVDYKFIDLQRKIKQSIVKTSGEITTNQEKLTVKVNDQLSSVHENVAAITNKLETHDRQLDELYSEIKSKSKISKVKDFLSGKKDKEQKQSAFIKNKEIEETKHHKVGITDLINVETVIEGGLLYKGMKSLYGLGKKGFKGAGRLAGKGAIAAGGIGKNLSKSAFMRLLVIIEKHLGAVAAKRLATAVGGSWIGPGVMVLVLGISLYDAYQIWQEFMEEENALNGVKPKTPLSPRGKFGPGFNLGQGNGPLGAPKQLSVPQGKFGPNWSPGITKPGVTPDAAIKNFQNNRNIQQNNDTARTYSPKGEVRSTQSPSQEIKTNQPNVEIKATAPKPESVLTNLNLKGISAADAPDFSNKGEDRYNTAIPASIRHNNPGATYPAKWMENYGMNGVDIIGGGHKIANFPDAISGTAANFNLFYNKYTGKDLQSAITMWSGGNSVDTYLKVINRETGLKPNDVITQDMIRDNPNLLISLLKAQSKQESGKRGGFEMTDDQWKAAYNKFAEIGLGEKQKSNVLPGMQKVIDKANLNQDLLQRSRQTRLDNLVGNEPQLSQFSNYKEYISAMAKYNSARKNIGVETSSPASFDPSVDQAHQTILNAHYGKISAGSKQVQEAMSVLGLHEDKDREQLTNYLRSGGDAFVPPSSAWCSAFVNASMERAGIKGTGSAAAGSWQSWGNSVDSPQDVKAGDVLVNRIRSPRSGMIGSHVVMATGPAYQNDSGEWIVPTIGGNQSMQGDPESGTSWVSESPRPFSSWNVRRASEEDIIKKDSEPIFKNASKFQNVANLLQRSKATRGEISPTQTKKDIGKERVEKVNKVLANVQQKRKELSENKAKSLANISPGMKKLKQVSDLKQKVTAAKNNKTNVAQNGAISGGKPVKTADAPKQVKEKTEPKKQQVIESKKEEPKTQKTATTQNENRGYRNKSVSSPNNNTADSIPPGPSDDGSGDYKRCLI